mgnify:CR=1 FL=1
MGPPPPATDDRGNEKRGARHIGVGAGEKRCPANKISINRIEHQQEMRSRDKGEHRPGGNLFDQYIGNQWRDDRPTP